MFSFFLELRNNYSDEDIYGMFDSYDIDRCTLFICTAGSAIPDEVRVMPGGKIETIDVEVPGAGLP